MRKTLLLVLTCSGLFVLSLSGRQYRYVTSPKTWAEAQEYCRNEYADLATVDNQAASDRLLRGIQDPGKHAWIGLNDILFRWKWSLGDAEFNDDKDFSNWDTSQHDSNGSSEVCVVLSKTGLWRDKSCEINRPALCFYEHGPSKYIFVETLMTWKKALDYCRSNYTDLARVSNKSENDQIYPQLERSHWIGLHRKLWSEWSDQSPVTFTNWNDGQPDSAGSMMTSCAAVNTTTGKWFDDDCQKKQGFICQTPTLHRSKFKLSFQSEADLNDPAIQQQILEQLHAKLKARGLSDFKLRWTEGGGQTFHGEQSKKKRGSGE